MRPTRRAGLVVDPRIDQRETFAVLDEIDVDVVESERQREPRPEELRDAPR